MGIPHANVIIKRELMGLVEGLGRLFASNNTSEDTNRIVGSMVWQFDGGSVLTRHTLTRRRELDEDLVSHDYSIRSERRKNDFTHF
jgi:hypothetical protein